MNETKDELKARLEAEFQKDQEIKRKLNRKYSDIEPRKNSLISSFNYAVEGMIYSLMSQRNMRIHYIVALIVLVASLFFDLTRIEMAVLFLSIGFVVVAEMLNTAIESAVDLTTTEYSPLAKIAKDVAAGAVLISVINSLAMGYLLFFDKINPITINVLTKIRRQGIHVTFVGILIILILVVVIKTYAKSGTPFQGGIVSGHAAMGFGLATSIALLS
ncbi:MAG: diacylglycerol kinase [Proteocatella sp.]